MQKTFGVRSAISRGAKSSRRILVTIVIVVRRVVFGDMTDFNSRFSNEFIGRKNAFDVETPRLQSQRTRNDTKRAVAVCKLGRILVVRPTVAAATSKSTGKTWTWTHVLPISDINFCSQSSSQSQNLDREVLLIRQMLSQAGMSGFEVSVSRINHLTFFYRPRTRASSTKSPRFHKRFTLIFTHSYWNRNWLPSPPVESGSCKKMFM